MDYRNYIFSKKEIFIHGIQGVSFCLGISYVFYDSYIAAIFLLPLLYVFFRMKREALAKERRQKLNKQFKDGILSISATLEAGYSMENAVQQALEELKKIYEMKEPIIKEFNRMIRQLDFNVSIEELFVDLAARSGVEDIETFAEVFTIAKRTGGNLIKIIQNTAQVLNEKIETQEDIEVAVSGKQMEQRIMSMVPFGIILYIRATSPDFLGALYGNLLGIVVMSICLLVYAFAYWLGKNVVEIEV